MTAIKNREECQAYIAGHHEQMAACAKEQSRKTLAKPKRDPCMGIQP